MATSREFGRATLHERRPGPRGRYLYAIVDGGQDEAPLGFAGMDGAEVYTLGDGRVSAVVSDLPDRKVRARAAAARRAPRGPQAPDGDRTVLPMAFGLIADGPESVRRILRPERPGVRRPDRPGSAARSSWACASPGTCPTSSSTSWATHAELAELRDTSSGAAASPRRTRRSSWAAPSTGPSTTTARPTSSG